MNALQRQTAILAISHLPWEKTPEGITAIVAGSHWPDAAEAFLDHELPPLSVVIHRGEATEITICGDAAIQKLLVECPNLKCDGIDHLRPELLATIAASC